MMPADVTGDEIGSPDDGRGQAAPSPYLGFGIERKRCAACAAYPSLPCAVHREEAI